MPKAVRVVLSEERHEEWSEAKGDKSTWRDVLEAGIGVIEDE